MLMIRLQRTGRKHEPTFRVVLTDSKNGPQSGKYLKNLGWYDTRLENKKEQIDTEQVKYWMSKGAQLSMTLHNYFITEKVIEGKKLNALPKRTPIKKAKEEVKAPSIAKAEEVVASETTAVPDETPAPAPTTAPEAPVEPAPAPVPEQVPVS